MAVQIILIKDKHLFRCSAVSAKSFNTAYSSTAENFYSPKTCHYCYNMSSYHYDSWVTTVTPELFQNNLPWNTKLLEKLAVGKLEKSVLCSGYRIQRAFHWPLFLTFRLRASCILGQAFHYSPENAFYIFNQQIYFII